MTASISCLALLLLGCYGFAVALDQGVLPAFRWAIPITREHSLIIHQGRGDIVCFYNSRPMCDPSARAHREFYIQYVAGGRDRTLLSIRLRDR